MVGVSGAVLGLSITVQSGQSFNIASISTVTFWNSVCISLAPATFRRVSLKVRRSL
jgi:hypothetical protein